MLRAGMHHASDEVSTARLPRSGTAAQNCRSSSSAVDSTMTPASASFCSCPPRIFRRPSISWDIFSNIWRTALTFTSPRSYRSRANLIARCSARRSSIGSFAFVAGACAATAASACRSISCDSAGSLVSSSCKGPGLHAPARARDRVAQMVSSFRIPRMSSSLVVQAEMPLPVSLGPRVPLVEPPPPGPPGPRPPGPPLRGPPLPAGPDPAPRWITPLPGFAPEYGLWPLGAPLPWPPPVPAPTGPPPTLVPVPASAPLVAPIVREPGPPAPVPLPVAFPASAAVPALPNVLPDPPASVPSPPDPPPGPSPDSPRDPSAAAINCSSFCGSRSQSFIESASAPRVCAVSKPAARASALGGVFRDETNFVDSNAWNAGQRRFQLLGQDRGLGILRGESAHQPFQVFLRDARRELNAGEACGGKQLGKAALGGSSFDGHAVEQKLRAGGAQQQAGFIGDGNRLVQFVPGGLELLGRARMVKAVEPRILEQNVEAADKGARGCLSWC